MKKIFKYELTGDTTPIELPLLFEVLCVQVQFDKPQVWILVDDYYEPMKRIYNFHIIATGEEVPNDFTRKNYIGTFQQLEGALIWHVFIDLDNSKPVNEEILKQNN